MGRYCKGLLNHLVPTVEFNTEIPLQIPTLVMPASPSTKRHQKHTKLQKPQWGTYARNEIAIAGTSCSVISRLAGRLIDRLSPQFKLGFVDAEHESQRLETDAKPGRWLTEREQSQRVELHPGKNSYEIKALFNEQDLVLLNGNHFSAESQIVVIDPKKSIKGRQEQLTDVRMVILMDQVGGIPDAARQITGDITAVPIYYIGEVDRIARELQGIIQQATPPLAGLVLAGGKSTRMHTDKTTLEYHGQPQRNHLHELLESFCDDVFISCREEQADGIPKKFTTITDSFLGMGPMGAILSAFRQYPNRAWLSVACDLPLLSRKSLQYLAEHRNPSKIATAFNNPDSSFPEPLITIWEPKSYPVLLHFLSLGYSCPRKVLINSDIELLEAPVPRELTNVNRPEEYREAKKMLTTTG